MQRVKKVSVSLGQLRIKKLSLAKHAPDPIKSGFAGKLGSVADPDPNPNPDPPDLHVFGPPGSGSIGQRYGSGSFYN